MKTCGYELMNELLKNVYERVVGRRGSILMIVSALEAGEAHLPGRPAGKSKSTILQAVSECTGRRTAS